MEDLNNLCKIKEFINWCKRNKIKSVNTKDISFEISDLAFVEQLDNIKLAESAQESTEIAKYDDEINNDDDSMQFWSSN